MQARDHVTLNIFDLANRKSRAEIRCSVRALLPVPTVSLVRYR